MQNYMILQELLVDLLKEEIFDKCYVDPEISDNYFEECINFKPTNRLKIYQRNFFSSIKVFDSPLEFDKAIIECEKKAIIFSSYNIESVDAEMEVTKKQFCLIQGKELENLLYILNPIGFMDNSEF